MVSNDLQETIKLTIQVIYRSYMTVQEILHTKCATGHDALNDV